MILKWYTQFCLDAVIWKFPASADKEKVRTTQESSSDKGALWKK